MRTHSDNMKVRECIRKIGSNAGGVPSVKKHHSAKVYNASCLAGNISKEVR